MDVFRGVPGFRSSADSKRARGTGNSPSPQLGTGTEYSHPVPRKRWSSRGGPGHRSPQLKRIPRTSQRVASEKRIKRDGEQMTDYTTPKDLGYTERIRYLHARTDICISLPGYTSNVAATAAAAVGGDAPRRAGSTLRRPPIVVDKRTPETRQEGRRGGGLSEFNDDEEAYAREGVGHRQKGAREDGRSRLGTGKGALGGEIGESRSTVRPPYPPHPHPSVPVSKARQPR
jgi:hypothetical protein